MKINIAEYLPDTPNAKEIIIYLAKNPDVREALRILDPKGEYTLYYHNAYSGNRTTRISSMKISNMKETKILKKNNEAEDLERKLSYLHTHLFLDYKYGKANNHNYALYALAGEINSPNIIPKIEKRKSLSALLDELGQAIFL